MALTELLSASGETLAAGSKAQTLVAPPWKHTLGLHRVGQTHLDIYSGYKKKFSSPQGMAAIKHTFNDEEGSRDDDELTVYGVNSGTSEIIYNTSRYSLGFFSKWEDGRLAEPFGIAVDRDGWVAVSDRRSNQIIFLKNESNSLHFDRSIDLSETGKSLNAPLGIAIENGKLYVTDSGNDRVVVTNRDGAQLETIGTEREQWNLIAPFGVAVIEDPSWNHYGSRFIIVTDSLNHRLCKLSMNGMPLAIRRFEEISGDRGGFFFVAIDYYSNVYATDTLSGCVYKFDKHLNYLTRFGCGLSAEDDLVEPRGITIYRRFGQVFIAERAGASYYWVGTDVMNPSAQTITAEGETTIEIRFSLTEQSHVTLVLEDEEEKPVRTLDENLFIEPGHVAKTYHVQRLGLPCPIAKCKYFVTVLAKATYSSRRYLEVSKRIPLRVD